MRIVTNGYAQSPHPGDVVRELCIDPLGLSVPKAAEAPRVSRKTLSSILNGRGNKFRNGNSTFYGILYFPRKLA